MLAVIVTSTNPDISIGNLKQKQAATVTVTDCYIT
jgi:hypothetical protein